jgi:hypothetical protein
MEEDALQFLPHVCPVFALKIEGIDVLIFLGRIFGILDGSIRPLAEPSPMLASIGVIGRCLERYVERDGEIKIRSPRNEASKVFNRAQL